MINDLDIVQWAYLLDPCFQLVNTAGKPLTEGYIEVYYHGTRTKYYCASDFDGTLHPFQIPLDSLGSNIVLASPDYAYDVYVYNKFGSLVMSRYNVTPGLGGGGGGIPGSDLPEHWLGTDGEAINIASDAVNVCLPLPVSGSVDYEGEFVDHFDDTTLYLNEGMYIVEAVIQFRQSPWDLHNSLNNLKIDTGDGDSSYYWQEDVSGPESNQNVHERKVTFIRKVSGEEPYPFYISPSVGVQLNDAKIRRLNIVKLAAGGTGGGHAPMYKPGPGIAVDDEGVISVTGMQPVSGMNEYVTNITYNNDVTEIFNEIHNVTGDITNIYNEIQSVTGDIHEYTAGSGIIIEDDVISLDPDYVASGAVTQEQLEGVTAVIENTIEGVSTTIINDVSGDISAVTSVLNDKIDAVSAAVPEAQVNADWNATEGKAEILNKPDLSVYATKDELQEVSSAIPTDVVSHDELQSVTSVIENTIEGVSTTIVETIEGATAVIENTIEGVSTVLDERIDAVSASVVQSDWTEDDTSDPAYIKNKPEEIDLVAGDNISIERDGNDLIISASAPDLTPYATNDELEAVTSQIESDIQAVSASIPEAQVQSDWTEAATGSPAYIKNKPVEYDLIAGQNIEITNSGNDIIIGAVIPPVTGFATEEDLQTVSGTLSDKIDSVSGDVVHYQGASGVIVTDDTVALDEPLMIEAGEGITFTQSGDTITISSDIPVVTGVATEEQLATVSATLEGEIQSVSSAIPVIEAGSGIVLSVSGDALVISATGAPTTELGKFTIKNNGEGGPIEVICPTDKGHPIKTVILDNTAVSGTTGSGTTSVYIVYKSPGYDDDYYSTEGSAILHIPEAVSGLANLQLVYAPNSNPASNYGPSFINPSYIYGDSTGGRYVLDAGDYDINVIANQVPQSPGGYGKYITLFAAGPGPDVQALLKSSFSLAVRHPELGITVDLDRYSLGNTNIITNTSNYPQAYVYTDPTSKKQSVYLPSSVPYSWNLKTAIFFQYGSSSFGYSNADTSHDYIAYKYNSTTRNYEFAELVNTDYNAKKFTFARTYNGVIEYWIADCTNGSWSATWSTETITIDMSEYIPYSASGVVLPNSKFEIDTEGQAYKLVSEASETDYSSYYDGGLYYGYWANLPAYTDNPRVMKAGTYRITVHDNNIKSLKFSAGGSYSTYNGLVIPVNDDNQVDWIITQDIEITTSNDYAYIIGYTNSDGTGNMKYIDSSAQATVKYLVPAVKEEYLTDGDIELNGDNQVIAIDGHELAGGGDVTMADLVAVSGDLEGDIQTVSAAIPDISNLATETELQTVSSAIDAVSAAMPEPQVQSDWTEDDSTDPAYIKNKPTEYDLVAGDNIAITAVGQDIIISADTPTLVAGSGIVIDEQNNQVIISADSDIYFATVNTTTWQEVKDAYDAGKKIFAVTSNKAIMPLADYFSSRFYFATAPNKVGINSTSPAYTAWVLYSDNDWIDRSGTFQANWNETDTSSASYIKNKPSLSNYATEAELQTVSAAIPEYTGASGIVIDDDTVALDDPIGIVAGQGITFTQDGDDIIISADVPTVTGYATDTDLQTVSAALDAVSAAIPDAQVNADWDAVSGKAQILNKPESTTLVAGSGITIVESGSNLVISAQGGGGTGDVTEQELAAVSGQLEADIQTVSGALPEYPEVTALIAGSGITIAASGEAFVISSQGGAGGYPTLVAGSGITIEDDGDSITISNSDSVSAVNVEAGTGIDIAPSGNSLIFSWMNTAGITDIQIVASLPATPDAHTMYLIQET